MLGWEISSDGSGSDSRPNRVLRRAERVSKSSAASSGGLNAIAFASVFAVSSFAENCSISGPTFSRADDIVLATFCSKISRLALLVTRPYRRAVMGPRQVGQEGGIWKFTGGALGAVKTPMASCS
jgi:hypothetical protein